MWTMWSWLLYRNVPKSCNSVDPGKTVASKNNVNCIMIWPVYAICKQQRRRPACSSTQSDERLCCLLPRQYNISCFYIWNLKPLAAHDGLCLPWSKTPKTGFLVTRLIYWNEKQGQKLSKGHCLASRGFADWCQTVNPRDGFFYPHRTTMIDSFSCTPFERQHLILM